MANQLLGDLKRADALASLLGKTPKGPDVKLSRDENPICSLCGKEITHGLMKAKFVGECHESCFSSDKNKVYEYVYGKDWQKKCPFCHGGKANGELCESCRRHLGIVEI